MVEHAFSNVYRATRKREGVDHVAVGENDEGVGQVPMRADGDGASDLCNVLLESFFFGRKFACLRRIARSEFPADGDFPFVGEAREVHGDAREIALGVSSHIQNSVGGYWGGLGTTLIPIEACEREAQDEKEDDEDDGALHRN